jgi:hypothetical protein
MNKKNNSDEKNMWGKDVRDMEKKVIRREESANANHAIIRRGSIQTRLYSDALKTRQANRIIPFI